MKAFREKFKIEELLITQVGSWNISLRPKQVTLGSLVLSLNRKCPEMRDLTAEEAADLSKAFKKIDEILKPFNPDKLNYLALMMVDSQVHFHVIPRYEQPIEFKGLECEDKDWPKPPILSDNLLFSDDQLNSLKSFLVAFIN